MRSIDGTIATLIKQINGIVSGQDLKVAELTDQLNAAVSEKQVALEAAKTDMDAANLLKSNVQKEIEDIRKVSQAQIAKAEQERDAAIRERDDARTIAAEKTKNNELLKCLFLRKCTVVPEERIPLFRSKYTVRPEQDTACIILASASLLA